MSGIYLCSCKARHNKYDIIYNDVDSRYNPDILNDCLLIDLTHYDYIIASPPCNYWSRANPYYKTSKYALATKHLLPELIKELPLYGVPFIIENVRNDKRMFENGIFDLITKLGLYFQYVGRHIYITNQFINLSCKQQQDFICGGKRINNDGYNQGGKNVFDVIEIFLRSINAK